MVKRVMWYLLVPGTRKHICTGLMRERCLSKNFLKKTAKARRKIVKNIILAGSQQLKVDHDTVRKIVKVVIEDIIGNHCD